ncbi:uncharacterized protein LOC132396322 isoform X3 [Hypanus sabinus]|uniref:uncharacterized protein LOC132396322 isoform X3 n=1 Tax=Hypanus sabinus TaxID=79690 RepID=UPI0028C446F3|nr:uncharacterized protein LOC132396322 isoform X3 [Hypanus sabinus]
MMYLVLILAAGLSLHSLSSTRRINAEMVKNCLQNTQIMMDIMCGRYSTNRIFVSSYQPGLETLFAQSSSKKNTLPLVLDPAAISLDADTSDPEGSSLEETSANAAMGQQVQMPEDPHHQFQEQLFPFNHSLLEPTWKTLITTTV